MAYATLIIDYEELSDVKAGLEFVEQELSNLKHIAGELKSMVGNPEPDLKGAIDKFEGSWNDNREGTAKSAKELGDAVSKILEDWNVWDGETAASLEGNMEQGETTSVNAVGGPV